VSPTMVTAQATTRSAALALNIQEPAPTAAPARAALPAVTTRPAVTQPTVAAAIERAAATASSASVLTSVEVPPAPPTPLAVAAVAATRYVGLGDLSAGLSQTPWPKELWPRVTSIALCESGIDTNHDGRYDQVDTRASGAGGRYIGVLQIGVDHIFSKPYDLRSLVGNLSAGYELWLDAGRSFSPWGCS
jgi:hypothetical protein